MGAGGENQTCSCRCVTLLERERNEGWEGVGVYLIEDEMGVRPE